MNKEFYIQRPQPTLVFQLSAADETEIRAALDSPNLTITRNGAGHWTFVVETGPDYEADDGDWVAYMGYFVQAADDLRDSGGDWQRVVSDDVRYGVG